MDVERLAVNARRGIAQGEFRLVSRRWQQGAEKPVVEKYSIVFSGRKIRMEYTQDNHTTGPTSTGRGVYVRTPEKYLRFLDRLSTNGKRLAVVQIRNAEGGRGAYKAREKDVFDPRWIGMVPINTSSLAYVPMDEILTRADRISDRVTEADVGGKKALLCEHVRESGAQVRYWVLPQQDYAVLRCEVEDSAGDGTFIDLLENELVQWESGGVWFPKRIKYQRIYKGEVVEEESVEVTDAVFNRDVDEAMFELSSMNIPAGYPILDMPPIRDGARAWDGKQLIKDRTSLEQFGSSAQRIEDEPNRRRTWMFLISLNLAIVAAICAYYLFRARRGN